MGKEEQVTELERKLVQEKQKASAAAVKKKSSSSSATTAAGSDASAQSVLTLRTQNQALEEQLIELRAQLQRATQPSTPGTKLEHKPPPAQSALGACLYNLRVCGAQQGGLFSFYVRRLKQSLGLGSAEHEQDE